MTTKVPAELSSTPGIVDSSNATALTIDSEERIIIGHTTALDDIRATDPYLQVLGSGLDTAHIGIIRFSNSVNGGHLSIGKSRSGTVGTNTIVQDGDKIGSLNFVGGDGSDYHEGAVIEAVISGTPGTGDLPTALTFQTTADGATASTEAMRITPDNKVGIGKTDPNYPLVVAGTNPKIQIYDSDGNGQTNLYFGDSGSNLAGYIVYQHSDNAMRFGTNAAERIRIASGGALMIGTTSDVGTSGARIEMINVSSGGRLINTKDVGNGSCNHITFNNSNGQVGRITTSGSSTAFVGSSDYRMKENIVYDWNATTKVKNLKPAQFNFKTNTDELVEGFIAHEAQSVVPYAIVGEKDGEEMQGMDYGKLTAILTKAIQEQQTIIEDLKSRIETLEG